VLVDEVLQPQGQQVAGDPQVRRDVVEAVQAEVDVAQDELGEALARHGLRNEDVCDFKPRNPASLLKAVLARRGAITDEQIPPIVDFVRVPDGSPLVPYLGYARKV
jgi:hypothetical protein